MAQPGFRGPKFTPKGSVAGQMMTLVASSEGQQVFIWNPNFKRPSREPSVAELRKKQRRK